MTMNIYYDKDADLSIVLGKKITVVGYGSQGHAHANNPGVRARHRAMSNAWSNSSWTAMAMC